MKERPILFTGPMVRAILAGRKTQTRRIVKPTAWVLDDCDAGYDGQTVGVPPYIDKSRCPYGQPGDRLWVRESWAYRLDHDHMNGTELYAAGVRDAWYWADGPGQCCNTGCNGAAGRVRAARFMPRWASRITLEITGVRVERLQEISEADAQAEGCQHDAIVNVRNGKPTLLVKYRTLWESINGPGSWDANPWVWVVKFKRKEGGK